jgi:PST family polysaccharide transporter
MTRIIKNMTALGILQIANYLIPLLVLPVVSRVLGATLFGSVGYAQNIVTYLTLLINYGFEYSATRQIALAGNDKERKRQLFWSVITAKAGLLVLSFVVLAVLPFFMERVACDPRLYIYTALTNIGIVFFPTWYLQGEQQMDKMAWANFFGKLLGAVLVISLVREASAYRLYPLLLSLASIAVGIGALVYVVRKYEIGAYLYAHETMREVLKAGWPIFLNNVFVCLYTTVNMTLLGGFATDEVIGYFSAAQRLIIALNMVVVLPVSTAIYPEISRRFEASKSEGQQFLKRVILWAGLMALGVSLLTYLFAPLAIRIIYGSGFEPAVQILRWLSPLPLLVMVATLLTVQGLYGMGLHRWAPWVGLILATVCISLNLFLLPQWGVKAVCLSWNIAETLECILVGLILFTKGRKLCST